MQDRRVIIHVGQTKAGSTSLQNYFDSQRAHLLENGILFPKTGFTRKNLFDFSRTAGHLALSTSHARALGKELEDELEQYSHCDVLISAENWFVDRKDSELRFLASRFENFDVEVVAVLRPQCDWLRSRYIENVMSGFISTTINFRRFVDNVVTAGALDYEKRLQHIKSVLGAKKIRAIPFECSEKNSNLIERFCCAIGLPDVQLATQNTFHSNVREKASSLIDAKRRLNAVTTDMKLNERLELEHRFRKRAKISGGLSDTPKSEFAAPIELSKSQVATILESNQRLLDKGLIDEPLGFGDMKGRDRSRTEQRETGDLFKQGLEIACGISARVDMPDTHLNSVLKLQEHVRNGFLDMLKNSRASLHINSIGSALLAASFERRFVRGFLPNSTETLEFLSRLDRIETASPLVMIMEKCACHPEARLREFLRNQLQISVDVVVLGKGLKHELITALLNEIPETASICLPNGSLLKHKDEYRVVELESDSFDV